MPWSRTPQAGFDAFRGKIRRVLQGYGENRPLRMTVKYIEHVQLAMPAGEEDAARQFFSGLLAV